MDITAIPNLFHSLYECCHYWGIKYVHLTKQAPFFEVFIFLVVRQLQTEIR